MAEQRGIEGNRVGVALVGCGNRGVNSHGVLAKESTAVSLVAVCDVDEQRVEEAEAKLGVHGEQDHKRLLERDDVQALIIATSAKWHVPIALDAVRAGKHVLIEKPLADTSAAGRELAQAAEKAGVVALVGYQARFTPFAAALKEAVHEIEPVHGLVTLQRAPFRAQFFFPDHSGGIMDALTEDATGVMLNHFADLITGRETKLRGATLREGADAVAVTEAAVESARTGRRVEIRA